MKIDAFAALRMYCESQGYPVPVAEHRFHPVRKWRFDAAFLEAKIAVEFQGGSWVGGRHTRASGYEKDREKMNEAVVVGWRVIEVTHRQASNGVLFGFIDRLFGGRK